ATRTTPASPPWAAGGARSPDPWRARRRPAGAVVPRRSSRARFRCMVRGDSREESARMSAPRSGHPYHMHDAIYAQPGALRLLTRGQSATLTAAAAALAGAPHVWLTGVGSSWHAALAG